ncbi:MAG: putative metal-binding motif-containing protein, partial [Myxococcales bacterium]|nr:putative metal-binding motif-containing protein [Myxococcales bacterium]
MRTIGVFFFFALAACDCGGTLGTACETASDCSGGDVCLDGRCQAPRRSDGGTEPGCVDRDGDGRGEGCSAGPDCNDDDPTQHADERCDGVDNDCDGIADEGALGACGDCDPLCMSSGFGPGGRPFEPGPDNADGVNVDDDGALVLDSERINTNFIWIANTT